MQIPKEKKMHLSGELWAICSYFNPQQYKTRCSNFSLFSKRLRSQGVRLVVAEAAISNHAFQVKDTDANHVLRIRTDSALWHKERLLNLAYKSLPNSCDKIVWLDGDVCFRDNAWAERLSEALETYAVVQPYTTVIHTAKGWKPEKVEAWEHISASCERGISSAGALKGLGFPLEKNKFAGHPGFAVAARREVLNECGGLYERMILGGGDSLFLGGCVGLSMSDNPYIAQHSDVIKKHADRWCEKVCEHVDGSIGCLEETIAHLWHGNRNKRYYAERSHLLTSYDPERDVVDTENHCLEWSAEAPKKLRQYVTEYFSMRNEDDENSEVKRTDAERLLLGQ